MRHLEIMLGGYEAPTSTANNPPRQSTSPSPEWRHISCCPIHVPNTGFVGGCKAYGRGLCYEDGAWQRRPRQRRGKIPLSAVSLLVGSQYKLNAEIG